jgi:hypothetical protein
MRISVVFAFALSCTFLIPATSSAQRLFAGLEDASLVTRSSDLAGFPTVTWTNHFPFEVNGAACAPDRTLYLVNGPFTTRLYRSTLAGPPVFVANVSVDIHGLGYGRNRLYGFSNFTTLGIYEINPLTGAATLLIDTSTPGFRFFGLDYNPLDDKLYGYTEYGVSGLYEIDIDSGAMTRLVGSPPAVNGQGRALAVGNNTVYLLATRGDDGEPCFAYDLAQGPGGAWVGFTNPYPLHHNTGGATWIPAENTDAGAQSPPASTLRLALAGPQPAAGEVALVYELPGAGGARLEIFDTLGRRVAVPVLGPNDGRQTVIWDGRGPAGAPVPSGIYLARLVAGSKEAVARIVIVR